MGETMLALTFIYDLAEDIFAFEEIRRRAIPSTILKLMLALVDG